MAMQLQQPQQLVWRTPKIPWIWHLLFFIEVGMVNGCSHACSVQQRPAISRSWGLYGDKQSSWGTLTWLLFMVDWYLVRCCCVDVAANWCQFDGDFGCCWVGGLLQLTSVRVVLRISQFELSLLTWRCCLDVRTTIFALLNFCDGTMSASLMVVCRFTRPVDYTLWTKPLGHDCWCWFGCCWLCWCWVLRSAFWLIEELFYWSAS